MAAPVPASNGLDASGLLGEVERLLGERLVHDSKREASWRAEVELLQRRLSKLMHELEGRDGEVRRLRAVLSQDPGLASVYEDVQGLDPGSEGAERKREMMAKIFDANLKLRERLTLNRSAAE